MANVSFLIGAGFSCNAGYPAANSLNDKIVGLLDKHFYLDGAGYLCISEKIDPVYYHHDLHSIITFRELLGHYLKSHTFDYEEFYDFYNDLETAIRSDKDVRSIIARDHDSDNLAQIRNNFNKIYNQVIEYFLVDRDGNRFYKPVSTQSYHGYVGFLNSIGKLRTEFEYFHFHSLNHDLLFEHLNWCDAFGGKLSDGFDDRGSPFYGELDSDGYRYKVRLKHFKNVYPTNLRLYKLHGSLDQVNFTGPQFNPLHNQIKLPHNLPLHEIFMEITDDNGNSEYFHDYSKYYFDFLNGKTSKINNYKNSFYKNLLDTFMTNLLKSELWVIIGYGAKDSGINDIIYQCYDKSKRALIIDPSPDDSVKKLSSNLGAKIISCTPQEMEI